MLEVKNLTFKVNENGIERNIVKDISFQVDDGEMLVITGPTLTTGLMRGLALLFSSRPDSRA